MCTTAVHFDMRDVSADKGYSSVNNVNVIASYRANPLYCVQKHPQWGGGWALGKGVPPLLLHPPGVSKALSQALER